MMKKSKPSNRDIVIRIATALFLEQGYPMTSMDEIVAASKVSKTNIYYHFKSKEELLNAIVTQMIGHYEQVIAEIAGQSQLAVAERLRRFASLLADQGPDSLGGCPFLTLYVQTNRESRFVREEISHFFQNQIATIERLLQEGIDRGEFSSKLPVSQIAVMIVSMIEGGLFLQHTQQDETLLPRVLHALAFLLK
jgi:AcrR family transcriptional regulator